MTEIPIKIEDWMPMSPSLGPPLPTWLGIFWPWYKPAVLPIYACPFCGAEFSSQAELLAHFASDHPTEPPAPIYICPICGAQFSTMVEYNQHVATVHPIPSPTVYTCTVCGEAFSTQQELDYHIQTAHPPAPPPPLAYACPVCGETFSTPRGVIDHIAINHLDYGYGLIFGTIREMVTSQPIEGALVTIDSISQITDSYGSFLFVDVALGSHIVRVTNDGFFPWEGESEINEPGDTESISVRLIALPVPGAAEVALVSSDLPKTVKRSEYVFIPYSDQTEEGFPVNLKFQINWPGGGIRYHVDLYTGLAPGTTMYGRGGAGITVKGSGLYQVPVLIRWHRPSSSIGGAPPVGDYTVQLKVYKFTTDPYENLGNVIPLTEIGVLTVIP